MKIAIAIPCHGDPKADFTFCLARLIAHTLMSDRSIELETLVARSSILVEARTRLFDWSREWGADYILWIDADQTFNPQSLLKLLARKVPVVAANCRRKHDQVIPSAVRANGRGGWNPVQTTTAKARADTLEEIDRIGLAFMLMEVAPVVAALGTPLYPLFEMRSLPNGNFIGEDSLFCDRLRAGGLAIYIDHAVSMLVGHIREQNLMFPG